MYETTYHRPRSLDEAGQLFHAHEEAKFLAGGQTLIPTMKQRLAAPQHLIDLGRLGELQGISATETEVTVGAGVIHARVADAPEMKEKIPALAQLAGLIGDPHVRHKGTLGGSLANNDPAADYPAAVLGLGARIETSRRTIDADAYFQGLFTTALEDDEIIVRVAFPIPAKAGYAKFPNPASRYAMAGVFVAQMQNGAVRVAVTGAGADGVFRWEAAEQALQRAWSADSLKGLKADEAMMLSDLHGNSAYRAHLVGVMARRAVAAA